MTPPSVVSSSATSALAPSTVRAVSISTHAALVGRALARSRLLLGAVCALLVAFQMALVIQAASQFESQAFGQLAELVPTFLRRTLGELTLTVVSFQGVVAAGFYHPVIVLLSTLLAAYVGTEPASDVEEGLVDLLLARPVARHALITRSLVLVAIVSVMMPATLAVTMGAALQAFAPRAAPWPDVGVVVRLAVSLALVCGCFGAIALAIAARGRRRSNAFATASVIAVLLYLIIFLAPTWAPAQAIAWLSPFHYFQPLHILAGRGPLWRNVLVLGAATACFAASAYAIFQRRDL